MPVVTCIEDLREMSRKRVARAIFDYVDRGSYTEYTLRANRADLERSRCASASASTSTGARRATTMLGQRGARCRWRSRRSD